MFSSSYLGAGLTATRFSQWVGMLSSTSCFLTAARCPGCKQEQQSAEILNFLKGRSRGKTSSVLSHHHAKKQEKLQKLSGRGTSKFFNS
jgi:hypothetical protein